MNFNYPHLIAFIDEQIVANLQEIKFHQQQLEFDLEAANTEIEELTMKNRMLSYTNKALLKELEELKWALRARTARKPLCDFIQAGPFKNLEKRVVSFNTEANQVVPENNFDAKMVPETEQNTVNICNNPGDNYIGLSKDFFGTWELMKMIMDGEVCHTVSSRKLKIQHGSSKFEVRINNDIIHLNATENNGLMAMLLQGNIFCYKVSGNTQTIIEYSLRFGNLVSTTTRIVNGKLEDSSIVERHYRMTDLSVM